MSPVYNFVESPIGDRFPKTPARFDRLKRSWSVLASDASKRQPGRSLGCAQEWNVGFPGMDQECQKGWRFQV